MGFSDWVYIDVRVIRQETAKAFQVVLSTNKIHWIPKSVVADAGEYLAGDRNLEIAVQSWFAEKEELEVPL